MAQQHTIQVIAHIRSDFHTKFGIPRQSGLVDALRATVVFEPEYRNPDALRGLEGFSHIWLIWQFSQAVRDGWSPTVRPPPPALPSGPTPSACPAWPWRGFSATRSTARCCWCGGQT